MYAWKGGRGPKLHDALQRAVEYTPRVLADRPSVLITEEGNTITIELPNLLVVIKAKN